MLRICGAEIEDDTKHEFGGIALSLFPMISVSPNFATCLTVLIILIVGNEGKSEKIACFKE